MVSDNGDRDAVGDELDERIRAAEPPPPSKGLLDRCLATISPIRATVARSPRKRAFTRRRTKIAMSLASVAVAVVAICLLLLPKPDRSDSVLAEVLRAFDKAPAYHITRTAFEPGTTKPSGSKDTWAVRGVGRRMEVRKGAKLVAVVVDDLRWRFHWDVDRDHVIAWPSEFGDPEARNRDDSMLIDRETFLKWGDRQKADVVPEKDQLDGREVEKVTLQWPGEIEMGKNTVWFDPNTHRPLKKRYESADGEVWEVVIEYPAPETVPGELFSFEVPRSATLEVNDPHLTRPLYSEGQTQPDLRK